MRVCNCRRFERKLIFDESFREVLPPDVEPQRMGAATPGAREPAIGFKCRGWLKNLERAPLPSGSEAHERGSWEGAQAAPLIASLK